MQKDKACPFFKLMGLMRVLSAGNELCLRCNGSLRNETKRNRSFVLVAHFVIAYFFNRILLLKFIQCTKGS